MIGPTLDGATDRATSLTVFQSWQISTVKIMPFALILAGAIAGCSQPSLPPSTPTEAKSTVVTSPNDNRQYDLIELDNGLEVILVSDPTAEKSAAALSVGLGASSDPTDYPGMAHYLEHMLFMGSAQFPEPDGFMAFTAEHGGMTNAYTGLDITNYMMMVENEAFPEALDRFASFFTDPLLDPTYIDKEKNAVNAEWSMRREQDFRITYRLSRKLLGEHPANRFQIGNLESLADKTEGGLHAATVAFFEQYYSANLMKASLIGNVPLTELKILAEAHFGEIPNKDVVRPETTATIDFAVAGAKRIRYAPQDDTRELRLDFIIDDNNQLYDTKPSEYLAYILASEMPDTPAVRLRDLGWASSLMVSADPSRYGNYGLFTFSVQLTPEGLSHRDDITAMLLGYIEMLREQGVDERYAHEFGTSLQNRFRFLEKMDDFTYSHELTRAMQSYPSRFAIEAPYRFTGFDQEGVEAVLAQLVPARMHVWEIDQAQPVSENLYFYDGQYAVEPLTLPDAAVLKNQAARYALAMPAQNRLLPEQFQLVTTGSAPALVIDEAGLSVWLQGSEAFADLPRGYAQIYLNSPLRQRDAESAVVLLIWSDLYNLEQTALINEAGIAGMGLNVGLDEGLRLSVSGFTDKQPELIAAALDGLRVDPTEQALDQAIDRFVRGLENRKRDMPVRQLGRTLSAMTRTGFYDEPSLLKAVSGLTPERFTQVVDSLLNTALVRVYLFGNYDEAFAATLAQTLRDALPAERYASQGYTRERVFAPTAGETLVRNVDVPVEDLGMMLLYAAPEASVSAEAAGRVLGSHLRNRTFDTLRTEEQLGYAAGGLTTMLQDHPIIGFYIQTPVKTPVDMLTRFQAFTAEYGAMLDTMTAEQFANLKSGALTQLTEPPTNLADEAGPFISDWSRERYDFGTRNALIEAVEAVTLDDIKSYYRETVLSDSPSRILVQLRGQRWEGAPFASIEGALVVDSVEAFHEAMPLQPLN